VVLFSVEGYEKTKIKNQWLDFSRAENREE
jgi:hypothetical protein